MTTSNNPIADALFGAFQPKQEPPRNARITQIPLDASLRPLGYVVADIDGNTVQIQTGPSDTFYPGDTILAQRTGSKSAAGYTALGFVSGVRPDAGIVEIATDIEIDGVAYQAGDQYLGALSGANWWFQYNTGVFVLRQGKIMHGAIGDLNGRYDYATETWGAAFGQYSAGKTWIATDPTNGFRIMSFADPVYQVDASGNQQFFDKSNVQRGQISADGSGWFAGATKFSWDTAGNVFLNGIIAAEALRLGEPGGGRIEGGVIQDWDVQGNPLAAEQWGIRIYDATGMPRITLATGAVDTPRTCIFLIGADTDPHYLRWRGGLLTVKGTIETTDGLAGGFTIMADRLASANGRVQLISTSNNDYGEGIRLLGGDASDTGVIAWFDPDDETTSLGIEYTAYDAAFGGWVKYSHVTTPTGTEAATKHVWVSGGWNSANATMEFDGVGTLSVAQILTPRITAPDDMYLTMHRVMPNWIVPGCGGTEWTNMGNVSRMRESSSFANGPAAQLLTGADSNEIPIPLEVGMHGGAEISRIMYITLFWSKHAAGHMNQISLVKVNVYDATRTVVVSLTNVEEGSAAGYYKTSVLTDPVDSTINDIWYLVIEPHGITANTDMAVLGVGVTCIAD